VRSIARTHLVRALHAHMRTMTGQDSGTGDAPSSPKWLDASDVAAPQDLRAWCKGQVLSVMPTPGFTHTHAIGQVAIEILVFVKENLTSQHATSGFGEFFVHQMVDAVVRHLEYATLVDPVEVDGRVTQMRIARVNAETLSQADIPNAIMSQIVASAMVVT
jgi:hypothetical protein